MSGSISLPEFFAFVLQVPRKKKVNLSQKRDVFYFMFVLFFNEKVAVQVDKAALKGWGWESLAQHAAP